MGTVLETIDGQKHSRTFTAETQIQAYRAWLLARCRQVWPTENEPILDCKLLELVAFWKELQHLSLAELLFPMKWEGKIEGTVCIASVLDFLIREKECDPNSPRC